MFSRKVFRNLSKQNKRHGVVAVVAAVSMVVLFGFVALSVDSGRIVLTKTEMQNAVDAAALAASQEITGAIHNAAEDGSGAQIDANSIAIDNARVIAFEVAQANGVYIDPAVDVTFGRRRYDVASDSWPIEWGVGPYNVVKVMARRDQNDVELPDGKLELSFGWAVGQGAVALQAQSTAFVQARDIVLVLDFSASMNDDSSFRAFSQLGQENVEDTLDNMWDTFRSEDPKWPGTNESKFPASGFGLINSYQGTYHGNSDPHTVIHDLGLDETNYYGEPKYPFPQAGRYSSGWPKSKPSADTSYWLWYYYIQHVIYNNSGSNYRLYGYRSLMDYMQESRYSSSKSEDMWRVPHYPFHAVKEGATLFLDFLDGLDFGDEVGLVSYGAYAKWEISHYDNDYEVDISENPITDDYDTLNEIQRRHQAGDYSGWTGMGDGIFEAREMLLGDSDDPSDLGYTRYGARPTMIVMTDGQTNQRPENWTMPDDFNWDDWTDYDGNGTADYSTSDKNKEYAFWEATQAINQGITLHTMSVGAGADRSLMEAIAFAGSGIHTEVPGGSTVSEMEEQMLDAFRRIAAKVPPPRLIKSEDN
ncbi:MAG: VWA domain-containing protein [Pirellulaceae bacterium]|nr:VWA domain-containing protein [Pirellulaceae bacterium]